MTRRCDQAGCKSPEDTPTKTFYGSVSGNAVMPICAIVCLECLRQAMASLEPPKAAVAYITREDGKILVVWNKRYGKWGFPGGRVEVKDRNPHEACIREVFEEIGMHTETAELIYEGQVDGLVEKDRGSYLYVFRVVLRYNPTVSLEYHHPREMESGCPITWFTREEFLVWGIGPMFYARMFDELDKKARESLLAPQRWRT